VAKKKRGFVGTIVRARMMRGALAGSRPWMVIAGISVARQVIRRLSGESERLIFQQKLEPGHTLVITNEQEGISVSGPRDVLGES
jgi:hypothetical protein